MGRRLQEKTQNVSQPVNAPLQRIFAMKLVKYHSEHAFKEQGRGILECVTDAESVRPGQTYYIRPNNNSDRYYETVLSPLQTIDMIEEFVTNKRLWKRI